MQREKSQYLLCYNNVWSTYFQEQKQMKIIEKNLCLSLFKAANLSYIVETRAYDIVHDENAMSSLIIQSIQQGQVQSSHRCAITKAVLKYLAIFVNREISKKKKITILICIMYFNVLPQYPVVLQRFSK